MQEITSLNDVTMKNIVNEMIFTSSEDKKNTNFAYTLDTAIYYA